jgi:hypothetical protein
MALNPKSFGVKLEMDGKTCVDSIYGGRMQALSTLTWARQQGTLFEYDS